MANDLTNIAYCISEFAYSDRALSIRAKLAQSFEKEKLYRKAGRQYVGIGLIYTQKGEPGQAASSLGWRFQILGKKNPMLGT